MKPTGKLKRGHDVAGGWDIGEGSKAVQASVIVTADEIIAAGKFLPEELSECFFGGLDTLRKTVDPQCIEQSSLMRIEITLYPRQHPRTQKYEREKT